MYIFANDASLQLLSSDSILCHRSLLKKFWINGKEIDIPKDRMSAKRQRVEFVSQKIAGGQVEMCGQHRKRGFQSFGPLSVFIL
jgi:hypothetical protein